MRTVLQLPAHHLTGARADALGPVEQSPRGPLQVLAVGLGHVLGQGGVAPAAVGAHMHGHALALEEALHGAGGQAHFERWWTRLWGTL